MVGEAPKLPEMICYQDNRSGAVVLEFRAQVLRVPCCAVGSMLLLSCSYQMPISSPACKKRKS